MARQLWERRFYAQKVVFNSGAAWKKQHPDVNQTWVIRAIAEPYKQEWDGDDIYFSWVPELRKWLKVVVQENRIATAHIDRRLLKRFGVPQNV